MGKKYDTSDCKNYPSLWHLMVLLYELGNDSSWSEWKYEDVDEAIKRIEFFTREEGLCLQHSKLLKSLKTQE